VNVGDLTFTGERFLPVCQGEIWLEHWHRYHFAASLSRDRRVLDVASGEGYGSALLALTAREVVGVDAAADAVAHAQIAYKDKRNLRFVSADCALLPFPDAAFDLVVSFETIEHITAQREFLAEIRRVLAPGGLLLLSSPNKAEYCDRRSYANPFHVAELYRDELRALLDEFFPHTAWYGQSIGFCSTIAAEGTATAAMGELVDAGSSITSLPIPVQGPGKEPMYYLVGCALSPAPLTALDKTFSVLGDPADTVYRDYQDTYRKFVAASAAVTLFREGEARQEKDLAVAGQVAQVSLDAAQANLDTALARIATVEAQRDAALAQNAESRAKNEALQVGYAALHSRHEALQGEHETSKAKIGRLQTQADDLKALIATLGATLHAAQQAALRLTGALHEANSRYQAALDAAHGANERLVQAAAEALERHRQEFARRDAGMAELQKTLALQKMELARRTGWRWRLRPPCQRD
jgi:hypothetical protein